MATCVPTRGAFDHFVEVSSQAPFTRWTLPDWFDLSTTKSLKIADSMVALLGIPLTEKRTSARFTLGSMSASRVVSCP
jgi:hypothetical protein